MDLDRARLDPGSELKRDVRASVRTGLLIGIAAATLVVARAGAAQRESPEELPPPESVEDIQPPLEEQVKEAKGETADDDPSILGSVGDELRRLPPFGEGASLRLTLRSYYMYGKLKTNNRREAWVYGGSVLYQTPQLGDRLALGAEFFVSQPIHAPSNRDGTLLLRRRQRQYAVFGQTYAKLELTCLTSSPGRSYLRTAIDGSTWRRGTRRTSRQFGYCVGRRLGFVECGFPARPNR